MSMQQAMHIDVEQVTGNATPINKRLPNVIYNSKAPLICHQCAYVNEATNSFCTYCGYPLHFVPEKIAVYKYRLAQKADALEACKKMIGQARSTLYVMAAISISGIVYLVEDMSSNYLKASVLLFISSIYLALARWTYTKPFTALLISFLMLISFMAINTWAEFSRMFSSATGVYLLLVQVVLFWFLYRGVKAAYQADVINDETV